MPSRNNLVAERMSQLVFGSVFILSIDSRYDTQVECSGGNVKVCIWRSAFLRFSWSVFDLFDDRRIILEPFLYLFLHTISRNWFSSGEVSWRYFHFITIHFDFSEWKTSFFVFAFELRYFWCFWFIFILVNFGITKNIYMYRSDYECRKWLWNCLWLTSRYHEEDCNRRHLLRHHFLATVQLSTFSNLILLPDSLLLEIQLPP